MSDVTPLAPPAQPEAELPPRQETPRPVDTFEASLLFLCGHYGVPASVNTIRAALVGDSAAMTPRQFIQCASTFGLSAKPIACPVEDMARAEFPLVLLLNDGRAVVALEPPNATSVLIFDPTASAEHVRLGLSALASIYEGLAVRIEFTPRRTWDALKAGFTAPHGHWFWDPLRENSWAYAQVGMAAAAINVLALGVSIFMMVVYDRVVPNAATESLVALTVGICFILIFDFVIKLLRAVFIDKAGERADLIMGARIFDHLLNMQMKVKRGSSGAFANMLREFETLRDFFTSASLTVLVDLPFILLFIGVLFYMCGPVALVPALAVPAVLGVGFLIQPFLSRLVVQSFQEGQVKQGVLVETIAGLETIKATAAAPVMRQRFESSIKYQAKVGSQSRFIAQVAMNATGFMQQMAQVGMIFFGVFQITSGDLSMGALVGGTMLAGRALAPLGQLAQTMTRLNQARTSFASIEKMMNTPSERPAGRAFVARPKLTGKLELRGVSFKYPGQVSDAVQNVSFTIAPGERVAILGRIGSGKSTIARLMLGLYEPEQGAVLVDDTDIRQIDPMDLRANVGSVLQDTWLFTGTVRQNIAAGMRRASDEDVLRAATSAGVHDFVSQHPEGYEMVLSERGEGLSGGQRQSVAIARALIADPPVMLMDEPTSAMDMQTEQGVVNRLKHVTRGKTVVVVTHRSSMLDLVDRVIIIDHGRVVADGPKSILNRVAQDRAASA